MHAARVVEAEWICPACVTPQRSPWPLLLVVGDTDTWDAVRTMVEMACGQCSARTVHRLPTVLVDHQDDPAYAIAVRPDGPGDGPAALAGLLSPWLLAMVDTVDWHNGDGAVLAHPVVVALLDRQTRRARLRAAALSLIGADEAAEVFSIVAEHPDLKSPEGVEVLDEWLSVAGLPPEGEHFRRAHIDLLAAAEPGVSDAAAQRFLVEQEAGRETMAQAGLRKMRWLLQHAGGPDTQTWDDTARSALVLLGFAGLANDRAHLLFVVGTAVDGRGVKSPDEIDWAIDCLRNSYDLSVEMDEPENAAMAAENLAVALQSRRHGDLQADTEEAVDLLTEVVRYRQAQDDAPNWAQASTNLAVTLMRLFDHRRDTQLIERAIALCRGALRVRPKEQDLVGWAFTTGNLALALTRVDAEPGPRPAALAEAVVLLRELFPMFAAQGATMTADKIRIDLCRTLIRLAAIRRDEFIAGELATMLGRPVDDSEIWSLMIAGMSPTVMSPAEVPPDFTDLFHGPPTEAEQHLLAEALALAQTGLDETRLTGDIERRSEYARIIAVVAQRRLGDNDEAVSLVTAMRAMIDHRFALSGAWETAADLAKMHARRAEWPAARALFDDCLAIRDWALAQKRDRHTTLQHLRRTPALARMAAVSRIRCGDAVAAVELMERSRLLSYAEVSGDLAGGSGRLLRSVSATIGEIGQVATPRCPLAYVVTSPYGSVVLLVRRHPTGAITLAAYDSSPTSGDFFGMLHNIASPELGLMSAQTARHGTARAVANMAGSLGRVLQPVVNVLRSEGIDRLLLIPTGPTTVYPWAAAEVTDPATGDTVAVVDLLVLTQAPSAMAAGFSQQRAMASREASGAGRVCVFADPDRPDAGPLSGARLEAAALANAFPNRTSVYIGADATRETLLRELTQSWLTHLACHGTNDWVEFEAMRLLLTGGDVTLRDLSGLPMLPSRLVFLSACQTGHADVFRLSDEMIGLPYSLLAGGAAAVVSTLWPIDDRATAQFVERFYTELAGAGDDVPLAMQRAQVWLRNSTISGSNASRDLVAAGSTGPHADGDPYHWAAFVCHGV